jgi:hypothetical protein
MRRFGVDSIPSDAGDEAARLAGRARRCGCVIVADGCSLILVEPSLSNLSDETRVALASNAGAVIALLRGESRLQCQPTCVLVPHGWRRNAA